MQRKMVCWLDVEPNPIQALLTALADVIIASYGASKDLVAAVTTLELVPPQSQPPIVRHDVKGLHWISALTPHQCISHSAFMH